MKKILFAAGAIYSVYMLLKQFSAAHRPALVDSDFDEAALGIYAKSYASKLKKHRHGNIRKLLKK